MATLPWPHLLRRPAPGLWVAPPLLQSLSSHPRRPCVRAGSPLACVCLRQATGRPSCGAACVCVHVCACVCLHACVCMCALHVCVACVRCMRALHVCVACALHVRCMCVACALHVRCMCVACVCMCVHVCVACVRCMCVHVCACVCAWSRHPSFAAPRRWCCCAPFLTPRTHFSPRSATVDSTITCLCTPPSPFQQRFVCSYRRHPGARDEALQGHAGCGSGAGDALRVGHSRLFARSPQSGAYRAVRSLCPPPPTRCFFFLKSKEKKL
jgi:hypothetical protein